MKRVHRPPSFMIAVVILVLSLSTTVSMAEVASAEEWVPTGSMNTNLYFHRATLLSDGMVLAVGGHNGSVVLASAEIYDPATNTWSPAASMSMTRFLPTATVLSNCKVLVTGVSGDSGGSPLASAEIYDPGANSWSLAADMGDARQQHTASLLSDGKLLVSGGST